MHQQMQTPNIDDFFVMSIVSHISNEFYSLTKLRLEGFLLSFLYTREWTSGPSVPPATSHNGNHLYCSNIAGGPGSPTNLQQTVPRHANGL